MADNTEKVISVRVDGIERALVSFEAIEAETKRIKDYLQETGRTLPDKQIKALAKSFAEAKNAAAQLKNEVKAAGTEIDKNNTKAKSLGRNLKEAFKSIGSDAIGGGGVSGLIGGLLGDGLFSLLEKGVTALLDWVFAAEEASAASESLTSSTESLTQGYAEEKVQLDSLFAPLFDVNLGTEERSRLIDEIESKYGAYIGDIDLERATQEELAQAYQNVNNAIIDNLIQKTKAKNLEEQFNLIAQKQIQIEKERQRLLNIDFAGAALDRQTELRFQAIENSEVIKTLTKDIDDLTKSFNENAETIDAAGQALKNIGLDFGSISVSGSADKAKNASANAEKAEQRRKEAIKEGVTDLESAIKRLNEVARTGDEEQITQAKLLVDLYAEEALQKIRATKAIGEVSGRSQEEIKNTIQLNEEVLKSNEKLIDETLGKIRLFNTRGGSLTEEQAKERLKNLINETVAAGRDINEAFSTIAKEGYIITNEQIRKTFGSSSSFIKLVTEVFKPASEKLVKAKEELKSDTDELKRLTAQQEAAGFSEIDIIKKRNDAILEADTIYIERQQELNRKKIEQLEKNPELIAKAYEDAGITESEAIENEKRIVIEAREKALRDIQADFDSFAEEVRRLGLGTIGGNVNEGFQFIPLDAADQQSKDFLKIVADLNKRKSLAFRKSELELENVRFAAFDRATRAAANASKSELRQLKADLKSKELEQDSYYDEILASNKAFAERRIAQDGQLGEQDINFIRSQKEEQIKLRQEATDIELKIEVDKQQKALASLEDGSEAYLTVLQEFENKKLEIINKSQDDLKKIDIDFENIIVKPGEDPEKPTIQQIISEITNLGNISAQLIDSIYQGVLNKQQEVIDGIQEQINLVDSQLTESQSKLGELEADLEGKRSGRREAILRGIESEREAEARLTTQKIELMNKLAKEEEKMAKKRKAAALTQAIINGALALTNIAATMIDPTPVQAFKIAAFIATAALTATQIAVIASQKFAEGGFTSDGQGGKRDDTGHIPVGIVHNDEYVIPRWMVKSPKYRPVIDSLEGARKRGFAEGGYTSPDFAALSDSVSPNSANRVYSLVQRSVDAAIALSERPIIANPVEFTNVERTVARRVNATTIGG